MNAKQLAERAAWVGQRESGTVVEVSEHTVEWNDGICRSGTGLSDRAEIRPIVGDHITIYGGFGFEVRGMDVNGKPSWFRTEAEVRDDRAAAENRRRLEEEERFARDKVALDAKFAALPENFQRRIAGFRAALPNWRVKYETYEMSACRDAVKIATWLTAQPEGPEAAYERFRQLEWSEQNTLVPDLFDGHSDNSFSFAMRLGYQHAVAPETVELEHGALVPLVGCADYGCLHPRAPL